jgi:hypothetical protein
MLDSVKDRIDSFSRYHGLALEYLIKAANENDAEIRTLMVKKASYFYAEMGNDFRYAAEDLK